MAKKNLLVTKIRETLRVLKNQGKVGFFKYFPKNKSFDVVVDHTLVVVVTVEEKPQFDSTDGGSKVSSLKEEFYAVFA